MEIIAEITRPGFAKLSIGDYSLCPLSEGSQGGVRETAVRARILLACRFVNRSPGKPTRGLSFTC